MQGDSSYGRGAGVARGLAVGPDLGVGVGRGVELAVAVAVAVGVDVGVAVAVAVGVGVGVGVKVAVAVAVGVAVAVAVGVPVAVAVGVGVGVPPWLIRAVTPPTTKTLLSLSPSTMASACPDPETVCVQAEVPSLLTLQTAISKSVPAAK